MAHSDNILETLEDLREQLKYEIMKEQIGRKAASLGFVALVCACVLGPLNLIPEALSIVGGILGGLAFVAGTGFSLYYLFAEDWRVNGTDVNHKRAIKSLRRKLSRLENDYNEALTKETERK